MTHYKSNLRDIEFNLFEVFKRQEVLGKGPFEDLDEDTARTILDEVNRLATGVIAESFEDADRNPPVFDPKTNTVQIPESLKKSYQAYMDAAVPGVADDPALFTAINKDTAELHHELVPFNADLAQRMSDRGVRILAATDAGELLPRVASQPDFYECRFCPWAKRCWAQPL